MHVAMHAGLILSYCMLYTKSIDLIKVVLRLIFKSQNIYNLITFQNDRGRRMKNTIHTDFDPVLLPSPLPSPIPHSIYTQFYYVPDIQYILSSLNRVGPH